MTPPPGLIVYDEKGRDYFFPSRDSADPEEDRRECERMAKAFLNVEDLPEAIWHVPR